MAKSTRFNGDSGEWEEYDDGTENPMAAYDPNQIANNPNPGIVGPQAAAKQPFDREAYRTGWGGGSPQDLSTYNSQWEGVTTDNDRSYLPTHEVLDMVFDAGGKNGYGWTGNGSWQGSPDKQHIVPDAPGGGGGGGMAGGGGAGMGGSPFQQQMRQMIMGQLGQLQQAPSINDPNLKAQSEAYRGGRDRGAQHQRAAAAERAAQNGLLQGGESSGGFDTEVNSILEGAGQDEAGYDAQLVGNEVQQRRQTLQTLMAMAMQSGDQEAAQAIQMQLAQMDNALRSQQLGQQQAQYDDQMGYRQGRDSEDDLRWRILLGLNQ